MVVVSASSMWSYTGIEISLYACKGIAAAGGRHARHDLASSSRTNSCSLAGLKPGCTRNHMAMSPSAVGDVVSFACLPSSDPQHVGIVFVDNRARQVRQRHGPCTDSGSLGVVDGARLGHGLQRTVWAASRAEGDVQIPELWDLAAAQIVRLVPAPHECSAVQIGRVRPSRVCECPAGKHVRDRVGHDRGGYRGRPT